MKLVIFFGLMIISLVISLLLGQFLLKRYNNLLEPLLLTVLTNIVILGLGSVWWFLTETDGLSQVLGVLYYCITMVIIAVINLIVLSIAKSKQKII
jgi:hypothetical protein